MADAFDSGEEKLELSLVHDRRFYEVDDETDFRGRTVSRFCLHRKLSSFHSRHPTPWKRPMKFGGARTFDCK